MLRYAALCATVLAGSAAAAESPVEGFRFGSIDGGEIGFSDWPGRPVLVANTASLCGFSGQYADLQTLYDTYREAGLVVLAVPSDDFRQELGSDAEVKEYCELTYGIDLPMTVITPVLGEGAHPFWRWLAEERGFAPGWNFNKVLIGADGAVLGTWGSQPNPMGEAITGAVEAALGL
jgi:glutathione peroxidase